MKKFLSGGKIWTILSALIFFMTCGLVAYATSNLSVTSRYTDWKTTSSDKKLEESEWNTLMDKLQYDAIPQGAIIAFSGSCPVGWSRFSDADGKFLRGSSSFSTNNGKGRGSEVHTLTTEELPAHTHYIMNDSDEGSITDRGIAVDEFRTKAIQNRTLIAHAHRANDDSNDWYNLGGANVSANAGKSSSVGSSMSFSIMNPYIYVIYCVKN